MALRLSHKDWQREADTQHRVICAILMNAATYPAVNIPKIKAINKTISNTK